MAGFTMPRFSAYQYACQSVKETDTMIAITSMQSLGAFEAEEPLGRRNSPTDQ